MTPAEFKTLSDSLGLSVPWLAHHFNVLERTVRYWGAGRTKVPEEVAAQLTNLDDMSWQMVLQGTETFREIADSVGQLPESVVLIRYRTDADMWAFLPNLKGLPATYHAATVSRMRRGLWELGVPSVIQYMEPDEYRKWLGKRKDAPELRNEWAITLPE